MQDFEKLGIFYLGKEFDQDAGKLKEDLVLYDARDLTTHAVCVGMTGSGKTGLCLDLLEEAAIDSIPALIIDPKGDLGNLLLTFPELKPSDFAHWVDPAEASRQNVTVEELGEKAANDWKKGLADWGQTPDRITRFRDAVDISIYTPGSSSGLQLTLLKSFKAPDASAKMSSDASREKIQAAVTGLLALVGINADPLRDREAILLANLFDGAWREGKDLDMANLIRLIQNPPFEKVGVVDLESFFPASDRFQLAMSINNLLASPGFQSWFEGEPLDIQRLLYTPEGKPRHSILSIAHLSDPERMFFVTIFLNEVISWMRKQSGTSSLRAILYMDEVAGYLPPTANPPSKQPMMTLLKQARAFGVGVVLATQNPVDVDYKGLSNAGTWFLGRLQTERDKMRVIEGLEGASTAAGKAFDRAKTEKILAGLGKRTFLMNNVHEDKPIVFQSRWALSYLRGPLTIGQIEQLMAEKKKATAPLPSDKGSDDEETSAEQHFTAGHRPVLPPGIPESFLPANDELDDGETLIYRPALLGIAKLHFTQKSADVDVWEKVSVLTPNFDADSTIVWDDSTIAVEEEPEREKTPADGATFSDIPADMSRPKKYTSFASALKSHLYQNHKLTLYKYAAEKEFSTPGETEGDFRVRLSHSVKESRDAEIDALREKYRPKQAALEESIRKAIDKVNQQKGQAHSQILQAIIQIGTSIVSIFLGRKTISVTNINRAGTTVRSASKVAKEQADISSAEAALEYVKQQKEALDAQLLADIAKLQADPEKLELEEISVNPKKADIEIQSVTLLWLPWRKKKDGTLAQLFE